MDSIFSSSHRLRSYHIGEVTESARVDRRGWRVTMASRGTQSPTRVRPIKQGVRKFATMFLGLTKQMVTCHRPIWSNMNIWAELNNPLEIMQMQLESNGGWSYPTPIPRHILIVNEYYWILLIYWKMRQWYMHVHSLIKSNLYDVRWYPTCWCMAPIHLLSKVPPVACEISSPSFSGMNQWTNGGVVRVGLSHLFRE